MISLSMVDQSLNSVIDGACCQPTMCIHAPSPNPPTSSPINNNNDVVMIPSSNPTSSPLSKKLDEKVQPKNEKEPLTDKTESMSMSDDDNDNESSSSEEVHDIITSADNALIQFEKCDSETVRMELWDTFVDNVKRSQYSNQVIKDVKINCDVDQFYNMFLSDTCISSLADYHKISGDTNITTSKWESIIEGYKFNRTISYTHPVYVPMGPPSGVANKAQTIYKFGNHGLYLVTKTFISDVPRTDCFYIEDYLLVKSNNDGSISISIMFDINFVKSTMFKSIITMTSVNDLTKFHTGYVEYIKNGLFSKTLNANDLNANVIAATNNSMSESRVILDSRNLLQVFYHRLSRVLFDTLKRLTSLDPFVLGVLVTMTLHQFLLLSRIKFLQGKLDYLEPLVHVIDQSVT